VLEMQRLAKRSAGACASARDAELELFDAGREQDLNEQRRSRDHRAEEQGTRQRIGERRVEQQ
jgi:hypothetical protein